MDSRPSFLTSTFSVMSFITVVGYVGLCVWTKNVDGLKELAMLLIGGYGVKKGMEIQKTNGNGHEPPKPV